MIGTVSQTSLREKWAESAITVFAVVIGSAIGLVGTLASTTIANNDNRERDSSAFQRDQRVIAYTSFVETALTAQADLTEFIDLVKNDPEIDLTQPLAESGASPAVSVGLTAAKASQRELRQARALVELVGSSDVVEAASRLIDTSENSFQILTVMEGLNSDIYWVAVSSSFPDTDAVYECVDASRRQFSATAKIDLGLANDGPDDDCYIGDKSDE